MRPSSIHQIAEQAPRVPDCAQQAILPRCVARRPNQPARYLMGVL